MVFVNFFQFDRLSSDLSFRSGKSFFFSLAISNSIEARSGFKSFSSFFWAKSFFPIRSNVHRNTSRVQKKRPQYIWILFLPLFFWGLHSKRIATAPKELFYFYYVIVFLNINGTTELYFKKMHAIAMLMSVQKCETGETENTSKITFRRSQTDNDLNMYVFSCTKCTCTAHTPCIHFSY